MANLSGGSLWWIALLLSADFNCFEIAQRHHVSRWVFLRIDSQHRAIVLLDGTLDYRALFNCDALTIHHLGLQALQENIRVSANLPQFGDLSARVTAERWNLGHVQHLRGENEKRDDWVHVVMTDRLTTAPPPHMLVDPLNDHVGNLQVVVILHEHVAVAEHADVRQMDVGDVTAGSPELRDLGGAGLDRARRGV